MRSGSIALAALGLTVVTNSGYAAPIIPTVGAEQDAAIVQVAGGCGRGWHPDWAGHCVPNRYRYYRPYPYWRPYYGDGHEPWNRPSPGDYGAADQLNRQQLSRPWWY